MSQDQWVSMKFKSSAPRLLLPGRTTEADYGVLVSNTGFSEEAVSWIAKHCSFVRLRTYKQIMARSIKITKLAKKFHHHKNAT